MTTALPYPYSMQPGPYSTWPTLLTCPDYPDNAEIPGYDQRALMPRGYGDYGASAPRPLPARVRSVNDAKMVGTWVIWQDEKAGKPPPIVSTWPAQTTIPAILQAIKREAQTDRTRKAVTDLAYEYWKAVQGGGRSTSSAPVPLMQRPGTTTFLTALLQGAGIAPAQAAPGPVPYDEPMPGVGGAGGLPKWVIPVAIGGGVLLLLGIVVAAGRKKR